MSAKLLPVPPTDNFAGSPVDVWPPKNPAKSTTTCRSTLLAFLKRPLGVFLTVLVAVAAAYAPSLNGRFLWDDTLLVKNNLLIRSPLFVLEVFRHTLFGDGSNFYRPTQTLIFLADYWFCGLDPFGYHLTSILIHAANAFLLCMVLRRILPTMLIRAADQRLVDSIALGVALVWAVHPVHSAAVAYISGTADTLAMMFCLAAILLSELSLRSASSTLRVGSAAGAFACLLLGLCAKEIASIWLVLYLGYLFGLRTETSWRARWSVVALAVLALGVYVGLRHLAPPPPAHPPLPKMPAKWLLMLRALGDYGSLLLFPNKLFMERQVFAVPGLANAPDEAFYQSLAIAGAALLLAFALGAWWPGRGQKLRRIGATWFLVGFLPISNLFALNASVAEHWLYLPSIGFVLCLFGAGLDVAPLLRVSRSAPVLALVGLTVLALGLRTWHRTFDWMDETTFFRQTIADGGDVARAHANLGVAYSHQAIINGDAGADGQAIAVLRDVVQRYPKVFGPRINLANALARSGDVTSAKSILEKVAADFFGGQKGDSHELVTTLRDLDLLENGSSGWPERRSALLAWGLGCYPNAWDLAQYDIQTRVRAGHLPEAIASAQRYAETHWWQAPARCAIGRLQVEAGHPADALAAWTEASHLDVHDAEALNSAAMLCLQIGHLREAHDYQAQALRRQPDSLRQHACFAQILEREGDHAAAQTQITLAKSLVEQVEGSR